MTKTLPSDIMNQDGDIIVSIFSVLPYTPDEFRVDARNVRLVLSDPNNMTYVQCQRAWLDALAGADTIVLHEYKRGDAEPYRSLAIEQSTSHQVF